jgi:hypothetical protein
VGTALERARAILPRTTPSRERLHTLIEARGLIDCAVPITAEEAFGRGAAETGP